MLCCLLLGLGVNPAMYEVDEGDEPFVIAELEEMGPTNGGGGGCGGMISNGVHWWPVVRRVGWKGLWLHILPAS